ncbi:MAG: pyridoxal phosphate-dependent decarboxylase family protein, partial [Acidobacteriota bacterium]
LAVVCRDLGVWLHVDGAFGLWAAASPSRRERLSGVELADSWATDAHKWLNVPYDSGIAIVADPVSHRRSMSARASYLERAPGVEVDPLDWVPESSRRARGFALYAALRSLGRKGITEMVERCCHHARHMARLLEGEPGFEILNDVVLNQVLVRVPSPDGTGSDELTQAVIARVQREGTCWLGGTTWHGMAAMRISISNWSTTEDDIGRSAAAIIQAKRAELG